MTHNPDQVIKAAFWQTLNPHLHINDQPAFGEPLEVSCEQLAMLSDQLHHDGYVHQGPIFGEREIAPLRLGIENLVKNGWPAAFIYIYDEVWALFASLERVLGHFLGEDFALLPHFWAWHILRDDHGEKAGWPAHVDYPGDCAFYDDIFLSLSLWIPLSDATPENGCMNVLPLSRQKTYNPPIERPEQIKVEDVRCLPAKAGSLLGWRQDLWHWSGRSSRYAKEPRISLSLEFQNRAFDPLCPPLFDLRSPPPVRERIRLIFQQFQKYDHMERVSKEMEQLGAEILSRS